MNNNRLLSLTAALVLALSTFAASVETDRPWYLAGETMTVGVTADDALIAYAELCDTRGLATGTVVSLRNGTGTGILELPSDLHSGYYVLSVYTRHSADVASRLVAVVNPLRKSADDDIEWVQIEEGGRRNEEGGHLGGGNLSQDYSPTSFLLPPSSKTIDLRETEGHIIKARIKNTYDGQTFTAAQITPSVGIVGKQIHYFEGKMVNDSMAVFYTYGVRGRQPLVLSAVTSTGVSLPIEMISPFAVLLPESLPHLVFHYQRSEVEARSLDMQRHQKAIGLRDSQPARVLDYDVTVLGTRPELTYNLDEYRQFFTVREVLLEYVNCVSNFKINDAPQLIVHIDQAPSASLWPSLVLIDGMPVINVERLLSYDARRIHYINIYGGQYTFGNVLYNGILSFVTRSGQLTNYPPEPNAQYLVYGFPE
ncbi:MAG: hypothetical protein IKH35_12745 [Prevotella sp.]|nr:hypothetical protein [Prevotella sp.]